MSSSKKRGTTAAARGASGSASGKSGKKAPAGGTPNPSRGATATRPARPAGTTGASDASDTSRTPDASGTTTPTARRGGTRPSRPSTRSTGRAPVVEGPAVVVGEVSPLARVAGGLAVLAALSQLLAPAFPLVTERGGSGVGGAANAFDFVAPLVVAVVLGGAGVLTLRGALPRLGMAAIAAYGAGSVGLLAQTLYLYETGTRISSDLPLPIGLVHAFRYTTATGLHLRLAGELFAVGALVLVVLAWSRTWMEDDGRFDPRRPLFAGLGLLVGFIGVAGVFLAGATSEVSVLGPQSVMSRSGVDAAGTVVLGAALITCGVVAPSLRPRQAAVGMFAGLATLAGGEALRLDLFVARADTLRSSLGGVTLNLAAVLFATLAVAAWYVGRSPKAPRKAPPKGSRKAPPRGSPAATRATSRKA